MDITNSVIENTAVIDTTVTIGNGNYIGYNTILKGEISIGDNNYIGNNVIIGEYPQQSSKKFEFTDYKEMSKDKGIIIGSNNVIREFTTVHLPVTSRNTIIGNDCYIMAYNHISHDSILGNNIIMANNIQMGGYTIIHDFAHIGLSSIIHQRSTIGAYAMIGMGSVITKDIMPFMIVMGAPAKYSNKINEHGMKRYNIDEDEINIIKRLYGGESIKEMKVPDKNNVLHFLNKFYSDSKNNHVMITEQINNYLSKTFS